jgi:SAM-dependent methyltransferase
MLAGMEVAEYARIARAEDAHWWYRSTRGLMKDMLDPWLRPGIRVLDAGCGPGGNSAWLDAYGKVVGVDNSPEAVRLARSRHPEIDVREGDIIDLPFADRSFDLVLAVTVLAMVPDDARAVRELARVARGGAGVFLIEPAYPRLRRGHDAVSGNRRRYRLDGLRGLAEEAGLAITRATYAYSFLVPAAAGLAAWHRLKPAAVRDRSDHNRYWLGGLFGTLAGLERRALSRRDLPFGLSAIVVAKAA